MYLNKHVLEKYEKYNLTPSHLKTIINRRRSFLTASGQSPTPLEIEALNGGNDLLEINFIDRVQIISKPIARVIVKTARGTEHATGFLVGPKIILTNNHVLPTEEMAKQSKIEFGYRYDVSGNIGSTVRFSLDPKTLFITNEALDYTLCAVASPAIDKSTKIESIGHIKLIPEPGKVMNEEFVTILQHPNGQPLQIALRENEIIRCEDGETVIWYRADTAPGSSGAPVFNDSLQLAALHQAGKIKRDLKNRYVLTNGSVSNTLEGLSENDVVWEANVGTRISSICSDLFHQKTILSHERATLIDSLFQEDDLLSKAVIKAKNESLKLVSTT